MAHDWKVVLGGAGQIVGSPTHDLRAMKAIKILIDPILRSEWFTSDLPFRWISIVIAYDTYEDLKPIYRRISKQHGDLPIVIRMKMSDVCDPDPKVVEALMMNAVLTALIHVAKKYKLPDAGLRRRRDEPSGSARLG